MVYGSVETKGRVNRRVSKRRSDGPLVEGGAWPKPKTAGSHDANLFQQELRGVSKEAVDGLVQLGLLPRKLTKGGIALPSG